MDGRPAVIGCRPRGLFKISAAAVAEGRAAKSQSKDRSTRAVRIMIIIIIVIKETCPLYEHFSPIKRHMTAKSSKFCAVDVNVQPGR